VVAALVAQRHNRRYSGGAQVGAHAAKDWSVGVVVLGRVARRAARGALGAYSSDDAFYAGVFLALLLWLSLGVITLSLLVVPRQGAVSSPGTVVESPSASCLAWDLTCP
jgi:hypothetical protein